MPPASKTPRPVFPRCWRTRLATTTLHMVVARSVATQPVHSIRRLGLKPVTFHYKSDSTATAQFGLIAEEVAKVNPNLVVRDENGEIYTVRYEAVNAMLLNEFLKEHRNVAEQRSTIAELKAALAKQQ